MDRERKMVSREVSTLDVDYRSLGSLLEDIQNLISQYGAEAQVEKRPYSYSDGEYVAVLAVLPETDEEMARRIAKEEHWQAQQALRDRAEFERLKAKFGG